MPLFYILPIPIPIPISIPIPITIHTRAEQRRAQLSH
jgi:hypothetical protein